MNGRFGVVILAAGASERSGRPKQLLPYLGRTLVEHAARTALASGAAEVVVVAGADADAVREKLRGLRVKVVVNRDWAAGKAGSIRCGIAVLSPETSCAVIALCDQSRITPELLRNLAHRQRDSGAPIVASCYDGVLGAPSAFGRELFPQLMSLTGDAGARDLIRQTPHPIETIEFSGGNVEVDLPADLWRRIPQVRTAAPRDTNREPRAARGPPRTLLLLSSPA